MVKFTMASPGPRHILYVDDDPDMRMLVKNTLENSNAMRVSVCTSAMEILEDTINSMPDLIILDVVMPVMDGKAILQEIKGDKRISHIPIIFLTSKSSEKEVQSLINLGAIGVIAKPFELTTLAQQVSALSLGQGDARNLRRLLFSGAADVQLDRQGRILIPQNLREYAGLSDQVIIAGLNTHFEIWSADRWGEVLDTLDVTGSAIAEQLAALGI